MGSNPRRTPRVSPTVKRSVSWVLTGIWLVGVALALEVLHTSLWVPLALLLVVGVAELAFLRWNEGSWSGLKATGSSDDPPGGADGSPG